MDIDNTNDILENISSKLEEMSIENTQTKTQTQKFFLDNNVDTNHSYFIAKVNLNFYQLWSIFKELPCVYQAGKCKYEWKFCHVDSDAVFSVYDWNNNNNLLNTKKWYVGCNRNDKVLVSEFLKVLCDAIECYNKYYKTAIETKTFSSKIPIVNDALQDIKTHLIINRDILNKL